MTDASRAPLTCSHCPEPLRSDEAAICFRCGSRMHPRCAQFHTKEECRAAAAALEEKT